MAGRTWSPEDAAIVERLYCTTPMSSSEIATIIGRTPGAVLAKIGKMNLKEKRQVIPRMHEQLS